MEKILGAFDFSGYSLVYIKPHGFPFIPVAYYRDDDGPCWSASQMSIDGYEMTFSQMAHNNPAVLLSSGRMVRHEWYTVLSVGVDKGRLFESASESYMKQRLYKIKEISVIPCSGLPAALKILYSPKIACEMSSNHSLTVLLKCLSMVRVERA